MLAHLINLLVRSFAAIPASLGSNWLGLIFPILVVIAGEFIAGFFWGWEMVKLNWKRATGIGFAALGIMYTLLFGWCVIATTFTDHMQLAGRNVSLHRIVDQDQSHEQNAVAREREKCAELKGANGVLETQNKDQQNSINLCQTEAIRRLQPEPEKVVTFPISELPGPNSKTFIMLTNKTTTPATILVTCDGPVTDLQGAPINTTVMTYSPASPVGKNSWAFTIASPAWAPDYPIVVWFKYPAGSTAPTCHFQRR